MATPQKKQWNESRVRRSKNGRFAKNNSNGNSPADRLRALKEEANRRGGANSHGAQLNSALRAQANSRGGANSYGAQLHSDLTAENRRRGTRVAGVNHTGYVEPRRPRTNVSASTAAHVNDLGAQVRNRQFNNGGRDSIGRASTTKTGHNLNLSTTGSRTQSGGTKVTRANLSHTSGSRTNAKGLPTVSSSNGRTLPGYSQGVAGQPNSRAVVGARGGAVTSVTASNRQMESDYKKAVREQQARLASRNRTQSNSVAVTNAVVQQHRRNQNDMAQRQIQPLERGGYGRTGQLDNKRRNRKIH